MVPQTESFRAARRADGTTDTIVSNRPVCTCRPFPGPVTGPCFPARSRYPVSRPGHGTLFPGPVTVPPYPLRCSTTWGTGSGRRRRGVLEIRNSRSYRSRRPPPGIPHIWYPLRCSTTWGTGSGRRRRLGTWSSWSGWWTRCVWGRVRCRRRRGSVRRRGESRRRRSLCAPPHPLRPAGYAPPFLNSFPGPLPLRPAARSAPRCSLLEPGSSSPARVSPGPRACGAAEARPSPYPSQSPYINS